MTAPIVHGFSAYGNGRCRCDTCRAAFAAYIRERRRRLRDQPVPPWVAHGTGNAYRNYGCRCQQCRDVNASYARDWQARRKAASS